MPDETRFTFIDWNDKNTTDSVQSARFKIKSQAAFHSHQAAKLRREQEELCIEVTVSWPPGSRRRTPGQGRGKAARPGRGGSKSASRVKDSRRQEAEAEYMPLRPSLHRMYARPPNVPFIPWIDAILRHSFNIAYREFWHKTGLTGRLGFEIDCFIDWMRFEAMQDPTMFYLFTSTAVFFALPVGRRNRFHVTWLRTQAIRELNIALSDPKRMLSSMTIMSVLTMTAYEAVVDAETTKRIHAPALRRMVALKGGEEKMGLELPGFVMVHARWRCQAITTFLGLDPILTPWEDIASSDGLPPLKNGLPRMIYERMKSKEEAETGKDEDLTRLGDAEEEWQDEVCIVDEYGYPADSTLDPGLSSGGRDDTGG
ncbi:hypothetical protein M409DRAFT_29952 [Zasmidium cellare ATCC 36951]|uniref:Uncharacterized protein n=1 Tax=Zasmidium cellare ATCC 36951 TaxID=1080233 RepID=A0A6A6BYE5_ZASCE|nr:uncharacterized protein M409DRAFT_29952 [Zasmidium cellare ATCC 36951]KAF2159633.1 hypothetical protein M409DRAFT_29952 [Zasmidium cellare ATCC 36951]